MSSSPVPQAAKPHVDWVRAAFGGAIAGGVLWAVVVKVWTSLYRSLSTELRLTYVVVGCLPLVVTGLLLLWRAKGSSGRTVAAAVIIAPCIGLVLMALVLLLRLPSLLPGR